VSPDIEVEYTPAEVIRGRDHSSNARQEALKLLEKNPWRRAEARQSISVEGSGN
jgi:hypothetical protein